MSKPVIRIKNISKKYKIRHESQYLTLREEIVNSIKKPFTMLGRKRKQDLLREDLWALKNVSFDVTGGEVVGIIGRNGAGKTTLLKILSRITYPTEGEIMLRGRIASLLEVGTGFHGELTGRENIFFNGAILGMKRAEIKKKFDEIVEFSETEKFLDTPAKRYSSGMYIRLGFAIAAHLESDILLVDEVLATGDISFQKKCLGKIDNMSKEGRIVLFVTHNIGHALNLCSKGILLQEGQIIMRGSIGNVINCYLGEENVSQNEIILPEGHHGLTHELRFRSARIYNKNTEVASQILLSEGFDIEIEYEILREIQGAEIEFTLWNNRGERIFISTDVDSDSLFIDRVRSPGRYLTRCHIAGDYLRADRYYIDISADIPYVRMLDNLSRVLSIDVVNDNRMQTKIELNRPGIITPILKWNTQKI